MNTVRARDVAEAVEMAIQMKRSGTHDWFRGQSQNWPIKSTLVRLGTSANEPALEKLGRFEYWVKTTPGLEHLAANVDGAVAVAQHYGLPTNFVDFTTDPRVAGFFASQAEGRSNEPACIVCVNVADVKDFWRAMPSRYPPPEFLEIAVPDLWRLEAQHGCFLFCPYDNIELLYDFDRIVFPNANEFPGVTRDEIYPARKSYLEVLLDQYFMNERMIEGEAALDLTGIHRIQVDAPPDDVDPEIFPSGLPDLTSWSEGALTGWITSPRESYFASRTKGDVTIVVNTNHTLPSIVSHVQAQVLGELKKQPSIRTKLVSWSVNISESKNLPPDFSSQVAHRLERLWDGLRSLPHSDQDIAQGFGMCLAFALALRGDFHNTDGRHWEAAAGQCLTEAIQLEFGAADGSYSRGFVAADSLLFAVRRDLRNHITQEWRDKILENPRWIIQTSWNPRKTFEFGLLAALFATEIAPFQVLSRTGAVFFSPARLKSLGLP